MNPAERKNCQFQRGEMDETSFFGKLFAAIYKADTENKTKLAKGFPDEVQAVRDWTRKDGYATSIMLEYDGFNENSSTMDVEIFNPQDKPVEELPTIFGFNNGGHPSFLEAVLLAEDGTFLGNHACSSENFMLTDLGILKGSSPNRHEGFRKHYPDGYKMEFISRDNVEGHEGLKKAYELNKKSAPVEKPTEEVKS